MISHTAGARADASASAICASALSVWTMIEMFIATPRPPRTPSAPRLPTRAMDIAPRDAVRFVLGDSSPGGQMRANAGGVAIHFESEGSGPPLVLTHGLGDDLHFWDP